MSGTVQNDVNEMSISKDETYIFSYENFTGEKIITVEENTKINLLFIIHNADIKLLIRAAGEHSEIACSCIVIPEGKPAGVNFSVILDNMYTKADIYALSLLGNNAKADVTGGIVLSPKASKSAGFLLEENLLLGKKVQIKTLPMLDVQTNDVQASHGAKIDRLDSNKLFYLTSKGLSMEEAKKLMIKSYIQKALDHVKTEDESLILSIFEKISLK